MSSESLPSLRKQLNNIVREEIAASLLLGKTDRKAVKEPAVKRAQDLIAKLGSSELNSAMLWLVAFFVSIMIGRMWKRVRVDDPRQMEFSEMDEFRGIPDNVTYEDERGHVAVIRYLDTQELERNAAETLLANSIAADQKTLLAMKAGNNFATALVKIYGDLPLWELYKRYKDDQKKGKGKGKANGAS
jgi:hypothetical protein